MTTPFLVANRTANYRSPGIKLKTAATAVAVLLSIVTPSTGFAQQPTQTHRMLVTDLPLSPETSNNVQREIWNDHYPELVKLHTSDEKVFNRKLPNSATVLVASFKDGKRTIILSALLGQCQNVSSAAPYWDYCPARIAVVENGTVHIIKKIHNLITTGDGPDDEDIFGENKNNRHKTLATFNSATQQLSTGVYDNGKTLHSKPFNLILDHAQ